MKRLILLAPMVLSAGCGSLFNQHAQMMDAMRGVMSDTAARLGESGTGQIQAGGHVINPGLRVTGGVEYYATASYVGLAGQVQAAMSGGLNRAVSPEMEARASAIWRDASLSDAEKLRLIGELLKQWTAKPASADDATKEE
ncbi:MAG TPA: hypothetical protein VJZ71_08830 [Phycisphaerae bacterium]|nr:hypothetical protein [Phycisphaerae bacterium]